MRTVFRWSFEHQPGKNSDAGLDADLPIGGHPTSVRVSAIPLRSSGGAPHSSGIPALRKPSSMWAWSSSRIQGARLYMSNEAGAIAMAFSIALAERVRHIFRLFCPGRSPHLVQPNWLRARRRRRQVDRAGDHIKPQRTPPTRPWHGEISLLPTDEQARRSIDLR